MTRTARSLKDWLDSATATRIMKAIALISLLVGLGVAVKTQQLAQCQAAYAEASNAASRQRNEAAEADRKALDDMVYAIVSAGGRPPAEAGAVVGQALKSYLSARELADKRRAENPLPAPPSTTCG